MTIFRLFGVFQIMLGALGMVLGLGKVQTPSGDIHFTPFLYLGIVFVLVGIGLLFHKQWAAALFVVSFGAIGVWMIVVTVILSHPGFHNLINLVIGGIPLAMAVLVILRWRHLRSTRGQTQIT